MRQSPALALVVAAFAIATVHARKTPDLAWPQFRGPAGAGILDQAKLPATWSTTNNVAWSVELRVRCEDRTSAVGARGAQGRAVWRAPSQEHVRF